MSDYREFDELLSRYFEGSISSEDLSRLEQNLLADEMFAQHVSQWCLMHRQIADLLTEKALHELMEGYVTGSPALQQEIFNQSSPASAQNLARRDSHRISRLNRRLLGFAVVAALIVVATSVAA